MSTFPFLRIESIDHQEARRRCILLLAILTLVGLSLGILSLVSNIIRASFGGHPQALCPFLNVTGIPCPFCGISRSLFSLLNGNLSKAVWYHPFGPALWGGAGLLGFCSFTLTLFMRKASLRLSQRVVVTSLVVVMLVAWYGNILYGHH